MRDSPEDLADRCYNCGRLYYRFMPSTDRPLRESKLVIRRVSGPLPDYLLHVFMEFGGTLHIQSLYTKMFDQYKVAPRQVRWQLDRDDRFSALGRGWWTITA